MKVGDYVRFDYHRISIPIQIAKVIESHYDNEDDSICYSTDVGLVIDESNLVKEPSPNIIDLIEENDFINGLRVEKNKYGELYTSYVYYGGDIGKQCEVYTTWLKEYTEDMIENIVTKEQFERMQYNLESEVN